MSIKFLTLQDRLEKMSYKDYLDEVKEDLIDYIGSDAYNKGLDRYIHSCHLQHTIADEYEFIEFLLMLSKNWELKSKIENLELYGFKEE